MRYIRMCFVLGFFFFLLPSSRKQEVDLAVADISSPKNCKLIRYPSFSFVMVVMQPLVKADSFQYVCFVSVLFIDL